eukprot:12335292-Alexandrium_andersonii.AAC.1
MAVDLLSDGDTCVRKPSFKLCSVSLNGHKRGSSSLDNAETHHLTIPRQLAEQCVLHTTAAFPE